MDGAVEIRNWRGGRGWVVERGAIGRGVAEDGGCGKETNRLKCRGTLVKREDACGLKLAAVLLGSGFHHTERGGTCVTLCRLAFAGGYWL